MWMGFAWDITISADTVATAPKSQILKLTYGVIVKIEVKFPRGCHGMVKIRLTRGGLFGVLPRNPDEWVTGDNEAIEFPMYFEIDDEPRELEFTGISPDTVFEHTVTVRISLLPKAVASMVPFMKVLTKVFERILGPFKV